MAGHALGRRMLFAVTAALSAAAMLSAPSAAGAAVRYAAPGSNDTTGDCLTLPCRVDRAVAVAAAYDSVELAPGDYTVTYPISAAQLIYVYGAAGGTPNLIGSNPTSAVIEMRWGGTLENVRAYTNASGQYALDLEGVNANRVIATADGAAHAVNLVGVANGTVLRNSIAHVRSGGGTAVNVSGTGGARSTTVLNVTALSPGGTAIATAGSSTKTIGNSIARGLTDIAGGSLPSISYSNYRSARVSGIAAGPGNQVDQAPVFEDEAGGDLRGSPGSPTIDAGAADAAIGTVDVAGQMRVSSAAVDIGAHEYQSPSPPPDPTPDSDPGPDPAAPTGMSTTTGTDSGTASATGAGAGVSHSPLPPATPPVLGTSVTLGEVRGVPRVRLPGTGGFLPLTADSTVPVGAIVDATAGTVELTSVRDATGRTQTGTFWGGVFQVRQSRRDKVTELALTGGDFAACKAKPGSRRRGRLIAARGRHSNTVRRLWGRDRGGRFRTRGRRGSATVRGTRWLTQDSCDGTLFKVTEGAIDVRDDGRRKTVRLKRGKSYLAAANKPSR